jgi:uncharacterized protein
MNHEMNEIHHEHEHEPKLRDIPINFGNLARLPVLGLIRFYQKTISRALPAGTCRFYPTCSHYGYQAIAKYGLAKGGLMSTWRVLRCQPFSAGGHDPVP